MSKVNLEVKLSQFSEYWAPRTVAQFNGHDIMVVKSKGEFVWHSHPDTDDFLANFSSCRKESNIVRSLMKRFTFCSSNLPARRIRAIKKRRRLAESSKEDISMISTRFFG